jgi:pimeloyl-ACP methyl ester carboxylesterase
LFDGEHPAGRTRLGSDGSAPCRCTRVRVRQPRRVVRWPCTSRGRRRDTHDDRRSPTRLRVSRDRAVARAGPRERATTRRVSTPSCLRWPCIFEPWPTTGARHCPGHVGGRRHRARHQGALRRGLPPVRTRCALAQRAHGRPNGLHIALGGGCRRRPHAPRRSRRRRRLPCRGLRAHRRAGPCPRPTKRWQPAFREVAVRLAAALPNADTVSIDSVPHFAMASHPEAFAAAALAFLTD